MKGTEQYTKTKSKIRNKPKLLDRVRPTIRTKHYSIRTEEAYVSWIKRFIIFHNKRHPRDMGKKEINKFLTHLAINKHLSASTQNQVLCAIVFLYKHALKKEPGDFGNEIPLNIINIGYKLPLFEMQHIFIFVILVIIIDL